MPELPEVETVRRSLQRGLIGRRITAVHVGQFGRVIGEGDPELFAGFLVDQQIESVERRGKYLRFRLSATGSLLVHLRMTGQLLLVPSDSDPLRFQHLAMQLDNGSDLRFADQRKFGRVLAITDDEYDALADRLGIEPLADSFTIQALWEITSGRSAPIKSVLLDQEAIAGIGNIYADEALHRAGIHPSTPSRQLSADACRVLHREIRATLREAIESRGTTFSTFRYGTGAAGGNQGKLRVYGRSRGGRCHTCGTAIERLTVGGRTSHFCPACQSMS